MLKDDGESAARKQLAALKPLIEKFRTQQAAGYETLEEIMLVLGGGITRAAQYKRLEETFSTLWSGRYGNNKYSWEFAKDRAQMLRLLKMMPVEQIEARMGRYVRNSDPFFIKTKHTFGIFVKTINQHAVEDPTDAFASDFLTDDQPATGCTHSPRCLSDAAHTTKINTERKSFESPF